MKANLFKILTIAAAFSMVQFTPVESAKGEVTEGKVAGAPVDPDAATVRALLQRSKKEKALLSLLRRLTLSSQPQQIC